MAAVTKKRRRRNHAADTRELLIAEAAKLFYGRGFGAVTIEEICAGLKPPLTKGAYYHIFDSKEAVLFAIQEKYMLEALAFINGLQQRPLTALQKFEGLFEHTVQLLTRLRPYVVVTILEQRHLTGSYAKRARRMRLDYRMHVEAIVRQGQEEKTIVRALNAKIVTLNYFAMLNWLYLWYRERGALSTAEVVAMCRAQFLRSILSDPLAVDRQLLSRQQKTRGRKPRYAMIRRKNAV